MSALPLRFRSLGRSFQPVISDAAALAKVPELEDAYWVASAATVDTLRADPGLLALLDSDADGRIRSDELRAAIRWLFATLRDEQAIVQGLDVLRLASVRGDAADGPAILAAARRMLRPEDPADRIGLARVREVRAAQEASGLSEAGRVPPVAAGEDAALKDWLAHVAATTGGVPHPSGEAAVTADCIARFRAEGEAWLAWHDQGRLPDGPASSTLLPLGDGTAAAAAAIDALRAKLDQYFLLCDTLSLDAALAERAWIDAGGADLLDAEVTRALLLRAPLARPRVDGLLDLDGAINPAWRAAVAELRRAALDPLLGGSPTLSRARWEEVQAKVQPWRDWQAARPAEAVAAPGAEVLRARLADAGLEEKARALLAESEAAAAELSGVRLVEKLLLFQQGLFALANSMVAMPDLYSERGPLFGQGRLVMDGREFHFAVHVNDAGRAERFASQSPLFIMFVRVGPTAGSLTRELMIPVTAGERGNLTEGMWGVFFDRDGSEHHAQVRKIASSPISIKEALLAPFRKVSETVQAMADKAAAEKTSSMDAQLTTASEKAVTQATTATEKTLAAGEAARTGEAAVTTAAASEAAPAASKPASSGMAGQLPMLAAGAGVALAAVSSAIGYLVEVIWSGAGSLASAITALPLVQALPEGALTAVQVASVPVALIVILLAMVLVPFLIYALPISIATWLRLRRRDLATLLEGSGWAINSRLFLSKEQAGRFTRAPTVPPTSLVR